MADKNREKSPGIALLLSFVPGLGAIYNGELLKGLSFMGIFVFFIYLLDSNFPTYETVFIALAFVGFYLYTIIDSYKVATTKFSVKESKGETEQRKQEDLSELNDPILSITVILFGFLFLFINLDIIDWETVRLYWPLLLIIAGIKLIYNFTKKEEKHEEKN